MTPFLVLSTKKERQDLYYCLVDTTTPYTQTQEVYELYSDVDGVIKTLDFSIHVITEMTGGAGVVALSMYKVDVDADSEQRYQDPYEWDDFSTNNGVFYTAYAEHVPDLIQFYNADDSTTYFHKRLSRNILKYDRFIVELNLNHVFDGSWSAGAWEHTLQIHVVVSPYKQGFDKSLEAMRALAVVQLTGDDPHTYFAVDVPVSGYFTNAYLNVMDVIDDQSSPFNIVITPDMSQRAYVNQTMFGGATPSFTPKRMMSKNSFTGTFAKLSDAFGTDYTLHTKHFGRDYVRVTGRKYLNFYATNLGDNAFTDLVIHFVSDFIPFRNANFKQRWSHTSFAYTENHWDGYIFPVDLKDAYLVMTSNITAGSTVLEIRLQTKTDQFSGVSGTDWMSLSDGKGDIYNPANTVIVEEIVSASHELDLIPLSNTNGAQSRTVPVGTVKAGDRVTLDFLDIAAVTGVLYFHVLGKIASEKYSIGSNYQISPQIANINALENKIGVPV